MDLNYLYLGILLTIITIYYLCNFYQKNQKTIQLIRLGRSLFLLVSLLVIASGIAILNGFLNQKTIIFFSPFVIISSWFGYQFYKAKPKSIQTYIYDVIFILFYLIVLYKTNS